MFVAGNTEQSSDASSTRVEKCLRKYPLAAVNPTLFITSTGSMVFEKMQNNPVSMFYNESKRPSSPVWIFAEDSWDVAHGRPPLDRSKLRFPACIFDVFKVVPWLYSITTTGGALDQFYEYAGRMEPCDQPLKIKSGKLLVRKLVAIYYTLQKVPYGTTVVWLDTDVVFRRPLDQQFYDFANKYDISYIPFTTNTVWGIPPQANFVDIDSPYWRIESGIVVITANQASVLLFEKATNLYRGKLLKLTQDCLTDPKSHPTLCSEIWFQRNLYLDDIFAFSMVLHQTKKQLKHGWLHLSKESGYMFAHLTASQTPYTSPFDVCDYFYHNIGNGAYSSGFRFSKVIPDEELLFSKAESFNRTVAFRFPGATPEKLRDYLWSMEVLEPYQRSNGILPANGVPRIMGPVPADWPLSKHIHAYSLPGDPTPAPTAETVPDVTNEERLSRRQQTGKEARKKRRKWSDWFRGKRRD
jgi:hypothetical protein